MKRHLLKATLGLLLCGALSAVPAYAQEPVSIDNSPKLAELAQKLSFTEPQKKQLDGLLQKYQQKHKQIQAQALKLQLAMRTVEISQLDVETINKLSTLSGEVVKAHTHSWLDTQREFYRMLNARQKNEYDRLRNARKQEAAKTK
ncbi:Spy/CpxP family protein refolding chaperone [Spongiibacter sp. KMU-158]|uniref:Spy/CpxP family protein refolding chaperone n=1 Tax=Spongiibacter pelagi TaxID=2760804 RepID=A0A927GVV4_9GAMM|nr:Spy/CpxP family protein refolding chaperone [Spongiibacter pelagi]MBD2858483.1 Spy/CpxP family protein refolding chaperone [Spongiibacter pelagi]